MANEPDEIDETETEPETEPETIDKSTVQEWVREAIEGLLSDIPGEGIVKPEPVDPDAPVTLRDMERIARETVEAAMAPLRETPKPKPKAKPKPKPETEPVAAPATKDVKDRFRSFLWGEE